MAIAHNIVAVGFSTFVMNLVGVDKGGRPITDVLSYAANSEGVCGEADWLRRGLGEEEKKEMMARTGCPIHACYAVAQFRALYGQDRALWNRIVSFETISQICYGRWTGERGGGGCSFSEGSWTGLLDGDKLDWDWRTIDMVCPPGTREKMPPLRDLGEWEWNAGTREGTKSAGVHTGSARPTPSGYGNRWPELLNGSCRLILGVGDGAAANVGSR